MPSGTQAIRGNRLLARNWKSKDANLGRKVEAQEKRLIDGLIEELARHVKAKDKCGEFPPKSVCLKKPFRAQPWIDSDMNVTNLLMVWRFLICFADARSLSPFTIDALVQAFHDTDSRLLGQVHIMLLRSITKDIECAANSGGGNPHIVEGFKTSSSSNDPGSGRIFVHLCEGWWRLIDLEKDRIPNEAFESGWSKKHCKHWGLRLISASSSEDLLQLILALLDGAIKRKLLASEACRDDLEGIPCTTSALALRLGEVDESFHCRLLEAGN
nr:homeobox-DDT domain protein RLT2-like isoform X1 [Ipomoea trifida]